MNYDKELTFAKNLALEAGGLMRQYFRSERLNTEWKSDNTPLTAADTAINQLVINEVKANFPEHGVLGEEESFEPDRQAIWTVDPIDGTVPFSLGMPLSTFSLALVDRNSGQPIVGVTYDPWMEDLYSATKNGGAFLNGTQITVSDQTEVDRGYFSMTGTSVHSEQIDYRPSVIGEQLRQRGARVLSFASFVYTANKIASGQLLGVIIGSSGAWDIAASSLLVQEAGGVVTDLHGQPRRFDEAGQGCIQAANPAILADLLELIGNK